MHQQPFSIKRLRFLGAFLFALVAICMCLPTAAQDNSLAQELLSRMSQAVRDLNYRGRFTFEAPESAIESYELTHRVNNGEETEILMRLNGREKVVVRDNASEACERLGNQLLRGQLRNIHPSDRLFSNYTLYLRGEQRVAGRPAYLLQLSPHDGYRNGQTIAVDKATFLPLQKQWFTPENRLIERLQFVDLELDPELDYATSEAPALQLSDSGCDEANQEPPRATWGVNWLPKGFFLSRVARTDEGEAMLSYTDGLASFSVFIREQPITVLVEGKADRGATIAYVGNRFWQQKPFRVTVIGEIPLVTAQRVVAAVEPVAD